jgi:hypothetical protein
MIRRTLRAVRRGARDFVDAFFGQNGKREDGPTAPDALAVIAKGAGQSVAEVRLSLPYCDPDLRLDVTDTLRHLAWYKAQGMVKGGIDGDAIIDRRYVVALPGG